MKPFSPEERQAIIDSHPAAAPGEIEADIDEYQALVSDMMARDPSAELALAGAAPSPARTRSAELAVPEPDERLRILHAKLFNE
jgi:hypothetical protein